MKIERPYNAEDTEANTIQREIIEEYARKIGEVIKTEYIYLSSVAIETESGRKFYISETCGCRSRYKNVRTHLYMCEEINGKSIRIKKEEW